ncbi:S-adenosyl-methyltransferase mraW-like protein, putative [Bodo saltans]|uniref:S-adenosyl-methyltransferase mraW-like protein, putative n=1 Tax=Bodo saltans TaxID=75058 RepID=A0A0S4J2S9_BODSA|nr:S-adenosyl-methyltransferase mraW-like protein, putative [Bodo saltans]|eukprot:CUG06391.1 S-adenosyl-methyltransferase mraW-like protein, putative [Bodo saltans]
MVRAVVQAVVGGRRLEDIKASTEFMAEKAIADGSIGASTKTRKAFHLPTDKVKRKQSPRRAPAAVTPAGPAQLDGTTKRLVTYDVLDCTFGGGMHSAAVLEAAPFARVVALDCDYAVGTVAKTFAATYGAERFRFFGNRMSESLAMFGESVFDSVLIDPGPTESQLMDPRRGFALSSENSHQMDMRYGPQMKLGALEYLNKCSQSELRESLAKYGMLTMEQCYKMSRLICSRRPFYGSHDVVTAVSSPGEQWDDDMWRYQCSLKKLSMPAKFMLSLRGVVNQEWHELKAATENGVLLLRNGGRLTVLTTHQWERELVSTLVQEHPNALLLYEEQISPEEVLDEGASRHHTLMVVGKTNASSFPIKNLHISEEEVQRSATEWVTGVVGGQTAGFPANNFSFRDLDAKERRAAAKNREGPEFDRDDAHWINPRQKIQ